MGSSLSQRPHRVRAWQWNCGDRLLAFLHKVPSDQEFFSFSFKILVFVIVLFLCHVLHRRKVTHPHHCIVFVEMGAAFRSLAPWTTSNGGRGAAPSREVTLGFHLCRGTGPRWPQEVTGSLESVGHGNWSTGSLCSESEAPVLWATRQRVQTPHLEACGRCPSSSSAALG